MRAVGVGDGDDVGDDGDGGDGDLRRRHIALHYLHEKIEVEVFLAADELTAAERPALQDGLHRELAQFDWFRRVTVWYAG